MDANKRKIPDLASIPKTEDHIVMVLMVDDQIMVGEAVRRLLTDQHDIEFHFCGNPAKAIETAEEVKPTVIVQDLIMPGIDGLDLVRQYRANSVTREVPIIVLSVREEPALKSEAFAAGANDYLIKLPDKIELVARIHYHSNAYLNRLQRDAAYRALHESQRQLMETNFELLRLSNIDELTGLSNRRYFDEYLDAEWRRAARTQSPLSVLMIDVDYFKQYNDTYGHPAGDEVLIKVADAMQKSCGRSSDLSARQGGDEFAMILPATDLDGAQSLATILNRNVENMHLLHSTSKISKYFTVTIGGASTIPQLRQSCFTLVDAADKALYEAKGAGRNRVMTHELVLPPDRFGTSQGA